MLIAFGVGILRVPSPMVVVTEMIYGLLALPRARQNLQTWEDMRIMFTFYEVDIYDAEDAAHLQHELRLSGKQLGTVDALIAAIAIRYDMTLLTMDQDFDHVPNLSVENWHK